MNNRTRATFLAICILEFAVALSPQSLTAQTAVSDGGLQPGDKVTITVWQRPELSGDFIVAPDGSLNHPLYRQIRATGIPAPQVEERLRSFLASYEANPQVVVQPHYKVAIAGAVMRPDLYDVPAGTTVIQAVTQAGGVSEFGKRNDVRLYRHGEETRLNLTDLEAVQMAVQSGDQILVKEKPTEGLFRGTIMPLVQVGFWIANIVVWNSR